MIYTGHTYHPVLVGCWATLCDAGQSLLIMCILIIKFKRCSKSQVSEPPTTVHLYQRPSRLPHYTPMPWAVCTNFTFTPVGVNDITEVLTSGVWWNPRGFNLRDFPANLPRMHHFVKTRGYKPPWLYNLPPWLLTVLTIWWGIPICCKW